MEIKEQDILRTIQGVKGVTERIAPADISQAPVIVQEALTKADEHRAGVSVMTSIGYESVSGNIKNRDFLIRRVIQNKDD